MYKYLGIELRSGLNFAHYKAKIVAEARKRMMLVWAMGMSEGALGVPDCVRAWQALVRPVLEYGVVVWRCEVGTGRASAERDGKDDSEM